jgi:hypothetical protein
VLLVIAIIVACLFVPAAKNHCQTRSRSALPLPETWRN